MSHDRHMLELMLSQLSIHKIVHEMKGGFEGKEQINDLKHMQVLVILSLKILEKKKNSYSCILFPIRAMKFRIGGAELQKCAM